MSKKNQSGQSTAPLLITKKNSTKKTKKKTIILS